MIRNEEGWEGHLIDVPLRYRMGWRVEALEEGLKRRHSQAVFLVDASVSVDAM